MPQPPTDNFSQAECDEDDPVVERSFRCSEENQERQSDHQQLVSVIDDRQRQLEFIVDDGLSNLRQRLIADLSCICLQKKPIEIGLASGEHLGTNGFKLSETSSSRDVKPRASVKRKSRDNRHSHSLTIPDIYNPNRSPRTTPRQTETTNVFSAFSYSKEEEDDDLTIWPVWVAVDTNPKASIVSQSPSAAVGRAATRFTLAAQGVRTGDTIQSQGCLQKFVSRPSSLYRITWDVFSIFVMAYDLVFIPMLVFDLPDDIVLNMVALAVACFWTFDMCFNFFVGFHAAGIIEMRPKQICLRYVKTWFILDFIVVAFDWFALAQVVSTDSVGAVRTSKTLKIVRVLRLARFLRMWKIVYLINEMTDFGSSENLTQFLGIVKFMVVILFLNHYIACGWYAIAQYYPGDHSWVDELQKEKEVDIFYKYTTSLHWSFTQFTPASMEVFPKNSLERSYNVIVLLSGLVVFSSFVSGITSAMTSVRENNQERNRQEDNLRRYITDNQVTLDLNRRIHHYVKAHRHAHRTRVLEEDVSVLKLLPPYILMDLHAEVFLPIIIRHPLFHQFVEADEPGLVEVCHHAMAELSLVKGQHLFWNEQKAARMINLTEGSLSYYLGESANSTSIDEKCFICEASLWLRWWHRGRLEAASTCVMFELRALDFHTSISKTLSFKSCQTYAQRFAKHIIALCTAEDEIGSPKTEFSMRRSNHGDIPANSDFWQDFDWAQENAQCAFEEQLLNSNFSTLSRLQSVQSMVMTSNPIGRGLMKLMRQKTKRPGSIRAGSSES